MRRPVCCLQSGSETTEGINFTSSGKSVRFYSFDDNKIKKARKGEEIKIGGKILEFRIPNNLPTMLILSSRV